MSFTGGDRFEAAVSGEEFTGCSAVASRYGVDLAEHRDRKQAAEG